VRAREVAGVGQLPGETDRRGETGSKRFRSELSALTENLRSNERRQRGGVTSALALGTRARIAASALSKSDS